MHRAHGGKAERDTQFRRSLERPFSMLRESMALYPALAMLCWAPAFITAWYTLTQSLLGTCSSQPISPTNDSLMARTCGDQETKITRLVVSVQERTPERGTGWWRGPGPGLCLQLCCSRAVQLHCSMPQSPVKMLSFPKCFEMTEEEIMSNK